MSSLVIGYLTRVGNVKGRVEANHIPFRGGELIRVIMNLLGDVALFHPSGGWRLYRYPAWAYQRSAH